MGELRRARARINERTYVGSTFRHHRIASPRGINVKNDYPRAQWAKVYKGRSVADRKGKSRACLQLRKGSEKRRSERDRDRRSAFSLRRRRTVTFVPSFVQQRSWKWDWQDERRKVPRRIKALFFFFALSCVGRYLQ